MDFAGELIALARNHIKLIVGKPAPGPNRPKHKGHKGALARNTATTMTLCVWMGMIVGHLDGRGT